MAKDSLKFYPELVPKILSGEKMLTIRREPKNLRVGDIAELMTRHDTEVVESFGYGRIIQVRTVQLADISIDAPEYTKYESKQAQLESYKDYYGDDVTLETEFWVYEFEYVTEES